MTEIDIKNLLQQQLPELINKDPQIRDFILRTVSEYYSPRQEVDSKFNRILAKLQRDRQEQARKWDEQTRKWDETLTEITKRKTIYTVKAILDKDKNHE